MGCIGENKRVDFSNWGGVCSEPTYIYTLLSIHSFLCTYIIELRYGSWIFSLDRPSHHQTNGLASLTDRAELSHDIIVSHMDYTFLVDLE